MQIAQAIKQDAYLRAVNLRKNRIGEAGIRELINSCRFNSNLLLMDVTENSGVYEKKGYNIMCKEELLKNLKITI